MKFQLLILVCITSFCFQVSFKARAETIPHKISLESGQLRKGGLIMI